MDSNTNLITGVTDEELCELSDDEKIDVIATRILSKYAAAFEELAK